ncbi:hypothetical protein [Actinocorallia populi]|uniref:hypothetical protein n=1 Tax=Actinocorallia populi TaxID=2079200 RepID=UPI000D08E210|nr:hypothetical protein [Actinocorallia populi]
MTTPTRKPVLSLTRDLLRVYDQRFLQVEQPVRRQVVTATKGMLCGLLTADLRQELPERERLRAFCIENELFDELERLIADEAAGRREGAVVVGGRVYAVYPYLRGVPRQDADITAEVGVEHRLESMAWSKGLLKVRGWARIARIQAKDPMVRLLASDGRQELPVETEPDGDGFEALLDLPERGSWTVHVEVRTLGLRRSAPFGTHLAEGFRLPPEREGASFDLDEGLRIAYGPREAVRPRRSWRFWRGGQA